MRRGKKEGAIKVKMYAKERERKPERYSYDLHFRLYLCRFYGLNLHVRKGVYEYVYIGRGSGGPCYC